MKLFDKVAALFGRKQQPVRDGYFEPKSETPADILRRYAEACDSNARRAENATGYAEEDARIARLAAISNRNRAAEYRAAAEVLDGGAKSEAA